MSRNDSSTGETRASLPVILVSCGGTAVCHQLQKFLAKNYRVIFVENCSDVYELASIHFPDLIIMSAETRYGEGLKVCEKLQKNLFKRRPASVMLFGAEDDVLIDQAFAAGADEYVREPIHWKLLHYRVNFLIEKRKAELELSEFTNRLKLMNRELQDFTYVVSHDLQEPLHLIAAFAERISSKSSSVLDEQGAVYLHRIEKAAGRMQSLIDGLLQYSRLTTQAKEFVPVNLTEIVRDVISDLEVRVDHLGANVKTAELGIIDADPLQMRQLFQNLVSNALKYSSPHDPVQVEIISSDLVKRGHGDSCQIIVKDNGIGFDSCFQEQIFGMFKRLHGRDEYNGTGIGLAICKKIVERHGGSITACSSAGKGAEFIVFLPVKQGDK